MRTLEAGADIIVGDISDNLKKQIRNNFPDDPTRTAFLNRSLHIAFMEPKISRYLALEIFANVSFFNFMAEIFKS